MAKEPKTKPGQSGVGEQKSVIFVRTVQYENEGRRKGPIYEKGRKYTFDAAFADRWIKRGAAYDADGVPPEPVLTPSVSPTLEKGGASAGADDYEQPKTGGF